MNTSRAAWLLPFCVAACGGSGRTTNHAINDTPCDPTDSTAAACAGLFHDAYACCPAGNSGVCREIQDDPQNCGSCAAACPTDDLCISGICSPPCTSDSNCGGSYPPSCTPVTPTFDPQFNPSGWTCNLNDGNAYDGCRGAGVECASGYDCFIDRGSSYAPNWGSVSSPVAFCTTSCNTNGDCASLYDNFCCDTTDYSCDNLLSPCNSGTSNVFSAQGACIPGTGITPHGVCGS